MKSRPNTNSGNIIQQVRGNFKGFVHLKGVLNEICISKGYRMPSR